MPGEGTDLFGGQVDLRKPQRVYSVTEITQNIKIVLEGAIGEVWVEGEVSNFQAHTSGHFYFTLKDDSNILPAAMFARANRELKFKIENGLKVICFGKVSAYGPRGQYQVIVEKIEPKGIGSLQLALEQLKAKLEKEGLFAAEHKRPIPYLPGRIGIVTSLQGAAIKDILKVLDRRFSDVHIIINSAQVQGEGAREEIALAIKELNLLNEGLPQKERIEVMIVGRGGGSIEDLWAFNEEIVARAIYNSKIPVISAVGHERDVTIADLVADLRAATPSEAAERVTPRKEDLKERLRDASGALKSSFEQIALNFEESIEDSVRRMFLGMQHLLELSLGEFDTFQKKLALLNPVVLIEQHKTRIADLARQIYIRMQHFMQLRQAVFSSAAEKLSSLSPLNILGRGYSITFKMPELAVIKDAKTLHAGDTIKSKLYKGEVVSKVMEVD
jgi:exodeoxyribonuclease VII large subunit